MQRIKNPRSIISSYYGGCLNIECEERSNGWWVVDDYGVVEGPFDNQKSAEAYIKIYAFNAGYSTKERI